MYILFLFLPLVFDFDYPKNIKHTFFCFILIFTPSKYFGVYDLIESLTFGRKVHSCSSLVIIFDGSFFLISYTLECGELLGDFIFFFFFDFVLIFSVLIFNIGFSSVSIVSISIFSIL